MSYHNPDIHLSADDTFHIQRVHRDQPDEFLTLNMEQEHRDGISIFFSANKEVARKQVDGMLAALIYARGILDGASEAVNAR